MNKRSFWISVFVLFGLATGVSLVDQPTEPWRPDQLMPAADLAENIQHPTSTPPLIICVGPSGVIKGSVKPDRLKKNAILPN